MNPSNANTPEPQKILVIHGGALGDLVLFIPTLRLLRRRFPKAKIVLLGAPYSGQALQGLTYLDELVLTNPKSDSLANYLKKLVALRKVEFDLLIDFHGTSRSRFQKKVINPQRAIAMARGDSRDRAYSTTIEKRQGVHMVGEYVGLLEHFGMEVDERDLRLELPVSPVHRDSATRLLAEKGVTGPYAVIQATTSGRPEHEVWAPENFARVAEGLVRSGRQVLASSDAKGAPIIERIQQLAECEIVNLAGKTDALTLGAILEKADVFFGYNTGPMHLAASVHIPVVAIFERPGKVVPWRPMTDAPSYVLMPIEEQDGAQSIYRAQSISVEQASEAIHRVLSPKPSAA